ncbi:hypothetical protein Tco_1392339 [Tanacetum coccineum]
MDKAMKESQLSEPLIKKVAAEIVNGVEVKIKGTKDFIKHQDEHFKVLTKAHTKKLKQKAEIRKKRFDQFVWTTNNRLKSERITDIFIHPNTKPVAIAYYKNNDPRNFDVHKNIKFGDFGISEWDELSVIIPKKKNKVRKGIELEPMTYIAGLHYRKEMLEGVKFVNNLVIKEPKHGLLFIDAFGDEAFLRVNDVHKVETETLLGYKVMASNVKTNANHRFSMLMSKMINERADKEKIMLKRAKLENL